MKLLDTDEEMGLKGHVPQTVFLSMPCECIKSSQVKPGLSLELHLQRQQWAEPVEVTLPSQTSPATALGHWEAASVWKEKNSNVQLHWICALKGNSSASMLNTDKLLCTIITLGFTQDPADEFPVSLTKMSTYNSVRRSLTQEAVRPFWLKERAHHIAEIKPGRHLSSQFVTYLSKASFPQHFVEHKAVYVEFSPCSSWHWLGCVYLPELVVLAVIC